MFDVLTSLSLCIYISRTLGHGARVCLCLSVFCCLCAVCEIVRRGVFLSGVYTAVKARRERREKQLGETVHRASKLKGFDQNFVGVRFSKPGRHPLSLVLSIQTTASCSVLPHTNNFCRTWKTCIAKQPKRGPRSSRLQSPEARCADDDVTGGVSFCWHGCVDVFGPMFF